MSTSIIHPTPSPAANFIEYRGRQIPTDGLRDFEVSIVRQLVIEHSLPIAELAKRTGQPEEVIGDIALKGAPLYDRGITRRKGKIRFIEPAPARAINLSRCARTLFLAIIEHGPIEGGELRRLSGVYDPEVVARELASVVQIQGIHHIEGRGYRYQPQACAENRQCVLRGPAADDLPSNARDLLQAIRENQPVEYDQLGRLAGLNAPSLAIAMDTVADLPGVVYRPGEGYAIDAPAAGCVSGTMQRSFGGAL